MDSLKNLEISRRNLLIGGIAGAMVALSFEEATASGTTFGHVLGRPTQNSAALSLIASSASMAYLEYGTSSTALTRKSSVKKLVATIPTVFELSSLDSDSTVFYRIRYKSLKASKYSVGAVHSFSTAKSAGTPFAFTLHGDTHPERAGKMFNADLYKVTLKNAASQNPDFHLLLGDDFSIDPLISKGAATKSAVEKIYSTHRNWLQILGASTPIFLVNGNHEQAAKYLLDGGKTNPAVLAGNARKKYFPLPSDGSFYSADKTVVPNVGLLQDYYSWTWGDATFITLDPYWHSSKAVDNVAGVSADQATSGKKSGSGKTGNLWQIGLGDEQYQWLKTTLETSKSKFIFVFAHHVMGTGRGAVEVSYNYEWGGNDPAKATTFQEQRPTWELPIHDLMVKHGVSIFFQGHDHIFVTQERDGLIYQSMPNPADDTFSWFNSDAYKSGVKAPNSGHVRVSVTRTRAQVEYFLAARASDSSRKNLDLAHSYTVNPRAGY
jgi:hypothetical protein